MESNSEQKSITWPEFSKAYVTTWNAKCFIVLISRFAGAVSRIAEFSVLFWQF